MKLLIRRPRWWLYITFRCQTCRNCSWRHHYIHSLSHHLPPRHVLFISSVHIGVTTIKNPFFLPSSRSSLDAEFVSNIRFLQMSPLLYEIYIERTKARTFLFIQIQKVHRSQLPPPPSWVQALYLETSVEPEAKETSIHKASKQQMASTGNLPLERLHCCLHIFLNSFELYQNACLFLPRSTLKRQRKANCKALTGKLRKKGQTQLVSFSNKLQLSK